MNRRRASGAAGVVALALAGWFVFAGTVPGALAAVASDAFVLGFAGLAAALGALAVSNVSRQSPEDPPSDPAPAPSEVAPLAETVDAAIERPPLDETAGERRQRGRNRRRARERLRKLAIGVIAARTGSTRDEAAERIREGSWTDDPRAAAFVDESVRLPLRYRFEDWLLGLRYRRGYEAAVRELERHAEGDGDSPGAPPAVPSTESGGDPSTGDELPTGWIDDVPGREAAEPPAGEVADAGRGEPR